MTETQMEVAIALLVHGFPVISQYQDTNKPVATEAMVDINFILLALSLRGMESVRRGRSTTPTPLALPHLSIQLHSCGGYYLQKWRVDAKDGTQHSHHEGEDGHEERQVRKEIVKAQKENRGDERYSNRQRQLDRQLYTQKE